ncbi:MAG: protoporphyrinogen oxidase [Acidobacteriota bacterium]
MPGEPPIVDVAVVGAGISGLATAFYLARGGLRVAVLEASDRVGGAISTERRDAFLFELGPNTVTESRAEMRQLVRDAGLEGERLEAAPVGKQRFLWKAGRLHALPSSPPAFLATRLFPLRAKLRLLREPWIARAPEGVEETVGDFVRRRLGVDLLDYAVAPFVSGVYAGDPERLAVRWAVPRIHSLETEHGSLIRGALARRKGPAPGGAMFSFPAGLEALPRRLAERVGDVRLGTAVRAIARHADGWRLLLGTGELRARRVVTAVPADVAAELLGAVSAERSRMLAELVYAPVIVVALGFDRADVVHPLDGFGFLAPRKEDLRVLGCLFPSSLFPGRAPEGQVALTAFLGGRTDPGAIELDDGQLLDAVLGDLRRALGVRGEPRVVAIRRWRRAIPQYEVGYERFVDRLQELEQALPGLAIGGNLRGGVSVPDCVKSSAALAAQILRQAAS